MGTGLEHPWKLSCAEPWIAAGQIFPRGKLVDNARDCPVRSGIAQWIW